MTTSTLTFAEAAARYRAAGWLGTLPLPHGAKHPPPSGMTGSDAEDPTSEQVDAWSQQRAAFNLALRVPADVLVLDVDAYNGGLDSLAELEADHGELPAAPTSTSRSDGGGHRFFRVPASATESTWRGTPAPGVDVLQRGHRFSVVWPSLHASGATYVWSGADDDDPGIPAVDELPELPSAWVEALTRPAREHATDTDVEAFLDGLTPGDPSRDVAELLKTFESDLDSDRHRALLTVVDRLAVAGAGGAHGVPEALALARDAFAAARGDGADREYDRALAGSVARIHSGELAVFAHPDVLAFEAPNTSTSGSLRRRSSWAPQDLTVFLDGDYTPTRATMMPRADGVHLIYPGLTHSFHGESESGKSMLLQLETVRLLTAGRPVLFVDFESDPRSVFDRLRTFGADREALTHLTYVRPDEAFVEADWSYTLSTPYDLAVVDGVTDSLTMLGGATKDNDDVARWMRTVPRAIADRTGAGVAVIDHVTKSSEGRGRFAIGGQAKMSSLTGAAYTVEVSSALAPGRLGVISVRVGKDRPGGVREHAGPFRKSDRTQEIARVAIDSRDKRHSPIVTWEVPTAAAEDGGADVVAARQTEKLRERVSRAIEAADGMSGRAVLDAVGGNRDAVHAALGWLVEEGYAAKTAGARGAHLHTSRKPFRAPEPTAGIDFLDKGYSDPRDPGSTDRFYAA